MEPQPEIKRGPKPRGGKTKPEKQRSAERRAVASEARKKNIAVLDFETDPFDNGNQDERIKPFLAVLYSNEFDPIIIWDENTERFIEKVFAAISALPEKFTIYAHNGGKFDYMFLVSRLRGQVMFKGRGIMEAHIAGHSLRDSFHIIPERLANWKKDKFDYTKLKRGVRNKYRAEIIAYCIADCRYLLEIVLHMTGTYGLKLSIGQMAQYEVRKEYKVKRLAPNADLFMRQFFFGGRVECLEGRGHWTRPMKLIDVNSMYPDRMANCQHPVGASFDVRHGMPGPNTVFIDLTCRNYGALVKRGENNETSANIEGGRFQTTIWEYETALKYKLIEDVEIRHCVDFAERSDFSRVIRPMYAKRILTKERMKCLEVGSFDYDEAKKDDFLLKYILNNMYGKFAQNPRRYQAHCFTEPDEQPPREWFPVENGRVQNLKPSYECSEYWIWQKPNPSLRFNNVATAASITGAARAKLMEAIQLSKNPIYCDTDSLICEDFSGLEMHPTELGAWDVEAIFDEVIITGKKQYACKVQGYPDGHKARFKIRSKGAADQTWNDFEKLLSGLVVPWISKAPTMTRRGDHFYMHRNIRATAPIKTNRIERLRA